MNQSSGNQQFDMPLGRVMAEPDAGPEAPAVDDEPDALAAPLVLGGAPALAPDFIAPVLLAPIGRAALAAPSQHWV